ncbi:Na+/H+ antiporter subunit E [Corynebacterium sp. 335C]
MKVLHVLRYGLWLVGQVIVAATEVIVDNFRIRQDQHPVLVGLPLRVSSTTEVTAFGASITMTPGTLVCGVREADPSDADLVPAVDGEPPRFFVVHCIFGGDPAALVESFQEMEEKLAPRVRDIPRPGGFLFDEYDPEVQPDPRAYIGTRLEAEEPGLWRDAVTPIVSGDEEVRP